MNTESNNGEKKGLRRCILDTTRHLLVEEGYKNLSMRKIARSIGYSATSIYLHFEDKDHLLHTLIDEGLEQLYWLLREAVAQHPDDPVARLETLCKTFINYGLKNPEYYEIMFLLDTEHMERYPAEKYRRARRNLELISETLEQGSQRALFELEDPRVSASTIWASLHGIVSLVLSRRLDVQIDQEAFIDASIDRIMRGFRASDQAPAPAG